MVHTTAHAKTKASRWHVQAHAPTVPDEFEKLKRVPFDDAERCQQPDGFARQDTR
jgi:hypothetical protein